MFRNSYRVSVRSMTEADRAFDAGNSLSFDALDEAYDYAKRLLATWDGCDDWELPSVRIYGPQDLDLIVTRN